jgi:AraC family transcriptional regulator of adaptative response/methylated-DNA-[protein]-cysteine methyltransferase
MTHATIEAPHASNAGNQDDARYEAIVRRDPAADETFFVGVRTTGVYCRPSCSSRTPLRRNVSFYATTDEAERAGFRPCKRCRPTEPPLRQRQAALVAEACRTIEAAEGMPVLADLARAAGVSSYYFHRVFKAHTGLTPREYARAHRAERLRTGLARGARVTDAMYDAGFNSSGRFYESSDRTLGMKPAAFQAGGRGASMRFAVGECSLGSILVAATERVVCAVQFGDDPDALVRGLQDRFPNAELVGADEEFERLVATVVGLVEVPGVAVDLPLDIRGTAFQQLVWQALREIPAGSTASYAEIAARIGSPKATRAVAQACGANPVAVAIPCHRVIATDGSLSGYRWGVERKRALLAREGVNAS